MKTKISVGLLCAFALVTTCVAYTKHYSFSGGYPANGGVSSSAAKTMANGGASMTTTAQSRQRVVNAEKSIAGRVTKVVDGDTITVTPNGGSGKKIRLRRIDAPESNQPCGDRATTFLKDLIGGKQVEVKYAECDSHGRILGTVFFKSEQGLVDVNLTMILNGWAWHYYSFKKDDKFSPYDKAEQSARNAKVGLWADENPIRPYDWRKSHAKQSF